MEEQAQVASLGMVMQALVRTVSVWLAVVGTFCFVAVVVFHAYNRPLFALCAVGTWVSLPRMWRGQGTEMDGLVKIMIVAQAAVLTVAALAGHL